MNITRLDSLKLGTNTTPLRAEGTTPERSSGLAEKPGELTASLPFANLLTQPLSPLRRAKGLEMPEVDLGQRSPWRSSQVELPDITKMQIAATLQFTRKELQKLSELAKIDGGRKSPGNDAIAAHGTMTDRTSAAASEDETLAEEGAAYFQVVATICGRIASNLLTIAECHPELLPEVNKSTLISKIAQFEEMDVPQDEYAVDLLSAYCADLIDFATSGSAFQKLLVLESVYPVLRDSPAFAFLAKSPLARYYLANIYLDNEDKVLRESSLSYIQRTYSLQMLSYRSQGLTVSVEEAAPWWDVSMCAEPSPTSPNAKKGAAARNVLVPEFMVRLDVLKRLKLDKAPGVAASEAVKDMQGQTTRFLTAHAEIFSIAYRLTELMGAESTWTEISEKSTTPCDVRDRCVPERSLAHAQRLQGKIQSIKQSGHVAVALESQFALLKEKLLELDAQAKMQDEVADLVAYLIRHDADIRLVNKNLRCLHVQVDTTLAEIRRQEIIASLLADEDTEKATQGTEKAKKAAKKKNKRKTKSVPSIHGEPALSPIACPVAADSVPDQKNIESAVAASLTLPHGDASFVPFTLNKIPFVLPIWLKALENFLADARRPSSTAVYELFTQVTGDPEIGRRPTAERCHIEGRTFWTHLPEPVLRAMLIPFVEPGSFGRAEGIGTNQVLGAAHSLHYHYKRHIVKKAHFWPRGARTPVEDYLDTALSFGSRVQRAIRKTNIARPSEAVWKKFDFKYFGLFSQDNKLISFGVKDSFTWKES